MFLRRVMNETAMSVMFRPEKQEATHRFAHQFPESARCQVLEAQVMRASEGVVKDKRSQDCGFGIPVVLLDDRRASYGIYMDTI